MIKNVISIQGLVSVISKHYTSNLPLNLLNKYTFRDLIKRDCINQQQKKLARKGKAEIEAIKKTDNIIGRTSWDRVSTKQINIQAKYHFCNEILRAEFYRHMWTVEKCERHSIFISQGSYPIKGLHIILEAMPIILTQFSSAKLYIAGPNIIKSEYLNDKLRKTTYSKYIEKLICLYNIYNNVHFTGPLEEKSMCERYLKSNVFVCPSSIENSPNSLCEAMILGVPSIASYVGGIPDMLSHGEEGYLYQSDAPYMLAHYVCEIFKSDKLSMEFSIKARKRALIRHDINLNTTRLMRIYNNILMS
jgi:glycosyltransferase involved in cell wall biosynthesis